MSGFELLEFGDAKKTYKFVDDVKGGQYWADKITGTGTVPSSNNSKAKKSKE